MRFDSNKLSHAYIVSGALADSIAMSAVCIRHGADAGPCGVCSHCVKASRGVHPDIIVVEKLQDKREILVDQIRALKKDVIVFPNEADRKVYIINDADLMNKNAQNALLQILEEPPRYVVFILRTDNPAALLPTVRSRCVSVKERLDADTEADAARSASAVEMAGQLFSAIENGNSSLVSFMFRLEKLDKEAFDLFLSAAREQAAVRLREHASGNSVLSSRAIANAEQVLFKAGEMLDLNVSAGHLSGMICANLITI